MRLFFEDIITDVQDDIGTTDATIKDFIKRKINRRYEKATSKLNTWTQSVQRTATTGDADGDDQQYYANPPNLNEIESIVVTIDEKDHTLVPVYSQVEWDALNAQTTTASWPSRYFPRAEDYGIWPIPPEDDGTITITYTRRATPLYFENYDTGTVTATQDDQTITVAGGANLSEGGVKADFWFVLTNSALVVSVTEAIR